MTLCDFLKLLGYFAANSNHRYKLPFFLLFLYAEAICFTVPTLVENEARLIQFSIH